MLVEQQGGVSMMRHSRTAVTTAGREPACEELASNPGLPAHEKRGTAGESLLKK